MSAKEKEALKAELLQRARGVAEAAGRFISLGSKVSSREDAMLAELARAFGD